MLKLNSGALEHSFYQFLIPQAASYVTRKNTNSPALSGGDSTVELKGKEGKEGKGKEGWREGGEEGGRGGEKGREWVLHKGEMCSGLWQVSVLVCTLCRRHDANAGTASRHIVSSWGRTSPSSCLLQHIWQRWGRKEMAPLCLALKFIQHPSD